MSNDEFIRTNPWQLLDATTLWIDDVADHPAYVGLVLRCTSKLWPLATVQFTFKCPRELVQEVQAALSLVP